jgi:hypothetical protein
MNFGLERKKYTTRKNYDIYSYLIVLHFMKEQYLLNPEIIGSRIRMVITSIYP